MLHGCADQILHADQMLHAVTRTYRVPMQGTTFALTSHVAPPVSKSTTSRAIAYLTIDTFDTIEHINWSIGFGVIKGILTETDER